MRPMWNRHFHFYDDYLRQYFFPASDRDDSCWLFYLPRHSALRVIQFLCRKSWSESIVTLTISLSGIVVPMTSARYAKSHPVPWS
jgi:hypothetical protein